MDLVTKKLSGLKIETYNMPEFELTRLLYLKNDVEHMCYLSLLKAELKEALFWLNELYITGYKKRCFEIIYTVYLLCYAYKNPKLDKNILNSYDKWKKEGGFESIIQIVINLIKRKWSIDVLLMYNIIIQGQIEIEPRQYKGRKQKFLENYDNKYHILLTALYKRDYDNICICIKRIPINKELYNTLLKYFKDEEKITLDDDKINDAYDSFISNELDNDNIKYILNIILLCITDESEIQQKKINILPDEEVRIYINELCDYTGIIKWKILEQKRIYGISEELGMFELERFKLEQLDLGKQLAMDWIYYASHTPYWREKLDQFDNNWTYDIYNKKVEFTSIEKEEEFEEIYCLEHDEQSKEIQDKAIKNIKRMGDEVWKIILYDEKIKISDEFINKLHGVKM